MSSILLIYFIFVVLELELRASCMLAKCSTTEQHPQPSADIFIFFRHVRCNLLKGYIM